MNHPSFSHEQPLPSTKVTRESLLLLEAYLVKRIVDASLLSEDEARSALTVKIQDSLGTEKLNSVQQMLTSRFADSTSSVEVELELPYRKEATRLKVRLSFTRGRLFTTLAIAATMPGARDSALGLRDGILRLLQSQKTWHWFFHPKDQVWGALFAVGGWIGYYLFKADGSEAHFPYLLGGLATILLYLYAAGSLRPYTVFDSRASDRADKIWSWFLTGTATFLIFGSFLTYFRRPILGF